MRTIALVLFTCVCFSWNGWSQPYTITTIAGTSRLLDGSSATSAPLRDPISIAVDSSGNLYIADQADSRVRKVDQNGIISTYAGTGLPGFSGDRGPANAAQINSPAGIALDAKGNMYVADEGNAVIQSQPATMARRLPLNSIRWP
jgi:DNA-binding beta-propeller fold protein YncE